MKKIYIIGFILMSMLFSSCQLAYEIKSSANQAAYRSIGGYQGILTLHTFEGDKVLRGAKILYVGIDNDDLFYSLPDSSSTFYYSGSCSFEFKE